MKKLILSLLCLLAAASTWAVDGQVPTAGESYYIYNVGQQQYLASDGQGGLSLSTSPSMAVTLKQDGNVTEATGMPTYYILETSYGQITNSVGWLPRCDGSGRYNQWRFTEVSGKDNVYNLSNRFRDFNTDTYLYYNIILNVVATEVFKPSTSFTNAQWMLVSASSVTKTVTFDETSETNSNIIPTDGDSYDVTLKRTFTTNSWNTFCVPFDISADQLKVFEKDADTGFGLAEYTDVASGTLYFTSATTVEAGKPYLIKPTASNPADGWTFAGVSKFTAKPTDVTYKNDELGYDVTFKASFDKTTAPAGSYVISQNTIYLLTGGAKDMKGFRGYFQEELTTSGGKLNSFTIDGTVTGIITADGFTETPVFDIYNLNGQLVKRAATSTEGLAKGIYIVGGRKQIVR